MAATNASTAADGTQSGSASSLPVSNHALSNDGRYVVFTSNGSTLTGTDANGASTDIFRKDLATGAIVRINQTADGTQANGTSANAVVSADGRYVLFETAATNLAGTDANGSSRDIFRKDLTTGAIVRVNEAADGTQASGNSGNAAISANGRYAVFTSTDTNLAGPGEAGQLASDVYRKDLTNGAIVRVDVTANGTQGNLVSDQASISDDGRYVVFASSASNLTGTDTNGTFDIFRKDLTTGALARVSETAAGVQGNGQSFQAMVSGDGRYVVFTSVSTNLAPGADPNAFRSDVYRKDMDTGELVRVNETADGVRSNENAGSATISSDGQYVTFASNATNIGGGSDTNNTADVFVKNMVTGEIPRLSNADGTTNAGDGLSGTPSISGDGSRVAFVSRASDLVASDTNGQDDVFVTQNTTVCFASGTRIRTIRGEVAVEALEVSDCVVTGSGARRPIRWIGHREVAYRRPPQPSLVLPVRIAAGAFGPGKPARDLTVSPAHALCVETDGGEVLIPAVRLINGTTVRQVEVESVTYWHVELDSHDILLADGMPAESYLDCGNRSFFANAPVTDLRAPPDARPDGALPFCRPFHEAGPVVEAVRARLEERARRLGWSLDATPSTELHILADGRVIEPATDGLSVTFVLPAGARDVRLVSGTSTPAHVVAGSTDDRRLGVPLRSLVVGSHAIALDDPRLSQGFHPVDRDADGTPWRWTDGAAVLPASLWAGCNGAIRMQVELAGAALPRWVEPTPKADWVAMGGLRHRG